MVKRGAVEDVWNSEFYKTVFLENRKKLRSGRFELIKLGRLCSKITKGATPNYESQGILFVKSENILQNELDVESTDFISKKVHEQMQRSQLKKNDVLFNIVGASIGRSCVFNIDSDANINQAVCLIRLKSPNYLPEWLSIILNSNPYQIWINQLKSGGARDNIDLNQVNNFEIPQHSLEIQNKIIVINNQAYETKHQKEAEAKALLESIDAYLLEKLGIVLPEKAKSKLTFFTRFKSLQGKRFDPFYHKVEFEINKETVLKGKYEVKYLNQIVQKLIKGRLPKDSEKEGECKVVQINSIEMDGSITLDNLLTSKPIFVKDQKMQKNDTLIVITGATIGKIGFWQYEGDYFLGGDIVKFQCLENVNPYFVYSYLRSEIVQTEIKRNITGATNGHLSPNDVEKLQIPLPPLPIQKEIADHITNIRQQAKTLQNEAKTAIEEAKRTVETMILG